MPSDPADGWSEIRLVTVRKVYGHMLAELLKSKLESAGIPAILRYESVGRVLGITVDGLGEVQIQVAQEMAERAVELLDESEPLDDLPAGQAEGGPGAS